MDKVKMHAFVPAEIGNACTSEEELNELGNQQLFRTAQSGGYIPLNTTRWPFDMHVTRRPSEDGTGYDFFATFEADLVDTQ